MTTSKDALRFKLKNFGPISVTRSEIKLRPLTIFIGSNASGKSYTAMLVKVLLDLYSSGILPEESLLWATYRKEFFITPKDIRHIEKIISRDLETKINLGETSHIDLSSDSIQEIIGIILDRLAEHFSKAFTSLVVHYYSTSLQDLVQFGTESFEISVMHPVMCSIRYDKNKNKLYVNMSNIAKELKSLKVRIHLKERAKAFVSTEYKPKKKLLEISIRKREFLTTNKSSEKYPKGLVYEIISESIIETILGQILPIRSTSSKRNKVFYFPAARSGILQAHKALAATLVKIVPSVGIEPIEIPKFSGTISDLIATILELPEKEIRSNPIAPIVMELESNVLHGKIIIEKSGKITYPEIFYIPDNVSDNQKIPLRSASSAISELAPLVLYLKYLIRPGDMIIIEEPEAHLHPKNQVLLAELLVKLAKSGVYVLLTTHSDYLLEKINNILLRSLKSKSKTKHSLRAADLGVYLFSQIGPNSVEVSELKISRAFGINQEEFAKIAMELYEERSEVI